MKMKNKKLKAAYKLVIADLKKSVGKKCKDYAMGCWVCMTYRLIEDLEDSLELRKVEIINVKAKKL